MPKLKTKSSTKGRFRRTGSGKLLSGYAKKRHGLRKRSKKMKRQTRGTTVMAACDAKIVGQFMPYS